MDNTNTAVGQWLKNKLTGTSDQPLTDPAIAFARRMLPMLGVTTMPDTTASTTKPAATGTPTMPNTTPDETTLTGRAASRAQYEGTKQQQNLEDISFGALPFINENAKPSDVEEDWLANYYDRGRLVSDKEMQKLWSHILASEVNQPGSFSIRTLNLLASLNKNEADSFKKLCSYAWKDESISADASITLIIDTGMISNTLEFGIRYKELYHLIDVGLINFLGVSGETRTLEAEQEEEVIILNYHGNRFKFGEKTSIGKFKLAKEIEIGQVLLTSSGLELATICEPEPDFIYMNRIIKLWKQQLEVVAL